MNDTASFRAAVGAAIRDKRIERGASQSALAKAAGVTQASLSNYERGKRDIPLATVFFIATALEVEVGDLIAGALEVSS